MKRDEWLNTLAMELPEWRKTWEMPDGFAWDGMETITFTQTGDVYTREDWLERRIELINCPPDSEAPEWATHKAQDKDGQWHWYEIKPSGHDSNLWMIDGDGVCEPASEGCVPAGHRWEDTLTEVNQCAYTAEEDAAWAEKDAHLNGANNEVWSGPVCGLPPKGTECEVKLTHGKLVKCKVLYSGKEVAVLDIDGEERTAGLNDQFRTILTPEQRAEVDAIEQLAELFTGGVINIDTSPRDIAKVAYAAIKAGRIPGIEVRHETP